MSDEIFQKKQWESICHPQYSMGMEGTKWRIFCCAIHLFSQYDYSAVSMRQIAEEVGIRASSIYNHFESKEDILAHIFGYGNHYAAPTDSVVEEILNQADAMLPGQLLNHLHFYYPWPLSRTMAKIIILCGKMMRADPRADALAKRILVEVPSHYVDALLLHLSTDRYMEEEERLAFRNLYVSNFYGAALRMYSNNSIKKEDWVRSINLLCHLLEIRREKTGKSKD